MRIKLIPGKKYEIIKHTGKKVIFDQIENELIFNYCSVVNHVVVMNFTNSDGSTYVITSEDFLVNNVTLGAI